MIALRVREPDLARPYRVAFYPWVPLAFVLGSSWIALYATWERPLESVLSLATVAAGLPLYWLSRRRYRPG